MTTETYTEHCRACKGTGGEWEHTSPDGPRGFVKCAFCNAAGRQSVMTQRKDAAHLILSGRILHVKVEMRNV